MKIYSKKLNQTLFLNQYRIYQYFGQTSGIFLYVPRLVISQDRFNKTYRNVIRGSKCNIQDKIFKNGEFNSYSMVISRTVIQSNLSLIYQYIYYFCTFVYLFDLKCCLHPLNDHLHAPITQMIPDPERPKNVSGFPPCLYNAKTE